MVDLCDQAAALLATGIGLQVIGGLKLFAVVRLDFFVPIGTSWKADVDGLFDDPDDELLQQTAGRW